MIPTRIGTRENLSTNETYDLLTMTFSEGFPVGKIGFEITNDPKKITGVQKVVQLFAKILFSSKGSDPINYQVGTLFPDYAINSNLKSFNQVLYSALSTEISSAESQVKSILNTPLSSPATRLKSVNILGINRTADSLKIGLMITTDAGINAQVAIPFPQLTLELNDV